MCAHLSLWKVKTSQIRNNFFISTIWRPRGVNYQRFLSYKWKGKWVDAEVFGHLSIMQCVVTHPPYSFLTAICPLVSHWSCPSCLATFPPSLPDICLSVFLFVVVFFLKPLLFDNSLLKKLHSLYFGICALELWFVASFPLTMCSWLSDMTEILLVVCAVNLTRMNRQIVELLFRSERGAQSELEAWLKTRLSNRTNCEQQLPQSSDVQRLIYFVIWSGQALPLRWVYIPLLMFYLVFRRVSVLCSPFSTRNSWNTLHLQSLLSRFYFWCPPRPSTFSFTEPR